MRKTKAKRVIALFMAALLLTSNLSYLQTYADGETAPITNTDAEPSQDVRGSSEPTAEPAAADPVSAPESDAGNQDAGAQDAGTGDPVQDPGTTDVTPADPGIQTFSPIRMIRKILQRIRRNRKPQRQEK